MSYTEGAGAPGTTVGRPGFGLLARTALTVGLATSAACVALLILVVLGNRA